MSSVQSMDRKQKIEEQKQISSQFLKSNIEQKPQTYYQFQPQVEIKPAQQKYQYTQKFFDPVNYLEYQEEYIQQPSSDKAIQEYQLKIQQSNTKNQMLKNQISQQRQYILGLLNFDMKIEQKEEKVQETQNQSQLTQDYQRESVQLLKQSSESVHRTSFLIDTEIEELKTKICSMNKLLSEFKQQYTFRSNKNEINDQIYQLCLKLVKLQCL
ncbi:Hypothetical_protein [Hexamita inflata]|uniref:Hypothetical_protein n=1 Tax=Hexamita inflata TaxID=28002 RepID=A0AA86RCL2_9EUKA|nr:Hypothetical protein HINF_LOCUS57609 [Hexamita inflata]